MSRDFTLNLKGELREFHGPQVMGIINVTPDSFYCNSRVGDIDRVVEYAESLLSDGATILDIGGCSTRPGSSPVSEEDELHRVIPAIEAVHHHFPDAVISVDTFRGKVAREAVDAGATIINDVTAGTVDTDILDAAVEFKVPYILTHPANSSLTAETPLEEVTATVLRDLQHVIRPLRLAGLCDIIIDPGFGFGKTLEQNYRIMSELDVFNVLECPVLVGISRKSMINRVLQVEPESVDSLTGTTVLNTFALAHGADIIRVHDVKAASDTIKILNRISE